MGFPKNNFYISAPVIMVLDETGKSIGTMNPGRAKAIANDKDLPLVCVNPNATPPVYRIGEPPKDGLSSETVRLMDENHVQLGVVSSKDARKLAEERGLDLIVVAPNQDPPVAMLGDRGKYEYEQKKRKREMEKKNRAAAKASELKEIRFPPNGGDSDRMRLIKQGDEFMAEGHPVNFTIRFPGRKVSHCDEVIDRVKAEMTENLKNGSVSRITRNGNNFTVICLPNINHSRI